MDRDEFHERLEQVDAKLRLAGAAVRMRPFLAFGEVAPGYDGPLLGAGIDQNAFEEYEGPNLLRKIGEWYEARYGERVNAETTLGRFPFLLRDEVFIGQIPLMYGRPRLDPLDFVEGLTGDMRASLTHGEIRAFSEAWAMACKLVYELEDLLQRNPMSHSATAKTLIAKAISDRDLAVESLSAASPHTNLSRFHSHQHAEKMLKATLAHTESLPSEQLKKFGHKIADLVERCQAHNPAYAELANDAALLSGISMDIRYTQPEAPNAVAVETYFAALRIGAFCACQLSTAASRRGSVYVDGHGTISATGLSPEF